MMAARDPDGAVSMTPASGEPREGFRLSRRTEAWLWLAVALIAAVLRLLVLGGADRVISTDGVSYIEIARAIATRSSFFHPVFPPGYPMWIALLQGLTGMGWVQAGQWTSCIFSMLLLVPLYAVFRRWVSVPAALLGLLFYACLPLWVRYGTGVQSIAVGAFWFFLALAMCQHAVAHPRRRMMVMAGAGLALGLAALARPELLVAAVVFPIWLVVRGREQRGLAAAMLLLVCFAAYAPYVLMLHRHTGHWQISMKAQANVRGALAVGSHDFDAAREMDARSLSPHVPSGLMSFWLSDPWATLKRIGINGYLIHEYMWPEQFPVILTLLLGLGLAVAGGRNLEPVGVVSLVYLPSLTFLIDARIMLPWATVFLAWAGAGAVYLLQHRRRVGIAVLACAVVLSAGSALHLRRHGHGDVAVRAAGLWLGAHAPHKQAWVWSRKPWVAFYAGMPAHFLPKDDGIAALIRPMRPGDWLVVDNRRFATARPKAFAGLFAGDVPTRLIRVKQFSGIDGHVLNLYMLGPVGGVPRRPERTP